MLDLPDPGEALLRTGVRAQPVAADRPRLQAVPAVDEPSLDFEGVVRRLAPRLQRYASRRLGDSHEAEELVQEALLRAYHHRAELTTEEDVAAWTTCVTGRLVIDRLRVRGRSTSVADVPEGARLGRDTADVVVARDEARLALDALDAMAPRQAAVLWAREVEGLSYDEIGARFDMTEPAVRSVLTRARKALRKEFATRGGTLPAGGLIALAPWLDGLTWVDRLRRLAGRAVTPATVGVASLGLIGGMILTPWGGSTDADAAPQPAVAALPTHEVAATRPGSPTLADAGVPARPAPAVPASAAAAATRTVLDDLQVNETCAHVGGARAGGASCNPDPKSALLVTIPVPQNPTGVGRVGVESNKIDCSLVPGLPFTECTSGQGEDR